MTNTIPHHRRRTDPFPRAKSARAEAMLQRLIQAGAALHRQAAGRSTAQTRQRRNRWLLGTLGCWLVAVVFVFCWPNSTPSASGSTAPPAITPHHLRLYPGHEERDNLAANIRPYYLRIPGGFDAALASAKQAAQRDPLPTFPRLNFDLLTRNVPVVRKLEAKRATEQKETRILGYYNPLEGRIHVSGTLCPRQAQEVLEHELTHAWQFAGTEVPIASASRHAIPLGSVSLQNDILNAMFIFQADSKKAGHRFVRDYLSTPIEIDPRLAAFKRWWAWNHGRLLDDVDAARAALERPLGQDLLAWPDVNDAVRIWDSYRNQPEIQELLLRRLLQLL